MNNPPVVSLVADPAGPVPVNQSVTFWASASDPEGDPINVYQWEADGHGVFTTATPSISLAWSTPGTYRVSVKVQDAYGKWSDPATVEVQVNADILPPQVEEASGCYTTTTPTFRWTFDGEQAAFELVVRTLDGEEVCQSGEVYGEEKEFTLPTSTSPDTPGPLWASGDWRFTVQVRCRTPEGVWSPWSDPAEFCVVAFERPRVREIVKPPAGMPKPDPADPGTHILIRAGMSTAELPATKAGGKVGLLIDTVGPVDAVSAEFPYRDRKATVGTQPAVIINNGTNKTWLVEFWTEASLSVCPPGTVVQGRFGGTGSEGAVTMSLPPYAAGIVRTQESAYYDWSVVLQGRSSP